MPFTEFAHSLQTHKIILFFFFIISILQFSRCLNISYFREFLGHYLTVVSCYRSVYIVNEKRTQSRCPPSATDRVGQVDLDLDGELARLYPPTAPAPSFGRTRRRRRRSEWSSPPTHPPTHPPAPCRRYQPTAVKTVTMRVLCVLFHRRCMVCHAIERRSKNHFLCV